MQIPFWAWRNMNWKRNPTSRFISHDILLDFLPVPTSNDSEKYLKSCKNKTFKDIPLLLLRKNIAKGTTDPRVAFISQDHSTEFTYWTYYNLRISAKHQLHTSSSIAENKKSLNSFKTLSLISTNVFLLASVFFFNIKTGNNNKQPCDKFRCYMRAARTSCQEDIHTEIKMANGYWRK